MITILTGAIKNTGDYLIGYRAKQLLQKYVDPEITEINRFEPLVPHLDKFNKSKALVLCGGPAYREDIFDGIYDLSSIYSDIGVPVVPFGLGWSGKPFPDYNHFQFTDRSQDLLKKIHEKISYSSCRDQLTEEILHKHGIKNVIMTGCPAWYDINWIDKKANPVNEIKKIIVTTPAGQQFLFKTLSLIQQIRKLFPKAEVYLSFHRGILPGLNTPPRKGLAYTAEALMGLMKGFKIKDVSGELNKISFYNDADLHVGFRVHAHLFFLSQKKPSFLINEDGRGMGMSKTLNTEILNGSDNDVIKRVSGLLVNSSDQNFENFYSTFEIIETFYNNNMLTFLNKFQESIN